jgi:alanine racemase
VSARPRLTVDLDAVRANYRRLCAEAPGADVAAVVKADGYGLGLAPVARTLFAAGARRFFVADVEEADELAAILPEAVVYVLGGYAAGARDAFHGRRLRPVLNTPGQVRAFAALPSDRRPPAALQVDTGMTRLGVPVAAIDALRHDLADLQLDFLVSHLACADDPDPGFSRHQRARFEAARRLVPHLSASLANSAGIFLGPDFHYDLCRPGIAVVGGNPRPGRANPMAPVVTLDAELLQVYALEGEARVGYGATYRAPAGARIATTAVGYADGVLRCVGNRGTARLAGVEVPLAGRVSMDLVGLDVTAVPTAAAVEGARVELIWGADGLDRMADAAGTIPYEVLVRLGPRVERRYRGGG